MTLFVDIDQTLADGRWRITAPVPVEASPEFYVWLDRCFGGGKIERDAPILPMRRLVFALLVHGSFDVYYLTAREEKYRRETASWLVEQNLFRGHDRLLMRRDRDPRTSAAVKIEKMDQIIRKDNQLVAVIDDASGQLQVDCCARGWVYLQVHDQAKPRRPKEE